MWGSLAKRKWESNQYFTYHKMLFENVLSWILKWYGIWHYRLRQMHCVLLRQLSSERWVSYYLHNVRCSPTFLKDNDNRTHHILHYTTMHTRTHTHAYTDRQFNNSNLYARHVCHNRARRIIVQSIAIEMCADDGITYYNRHFALSRVGNRRMLLLCLIPMCLLFCGGDVCGLSSVSSTTQPPSSSYFMCVCFRLLL